ncbi:unnamed protein product [Auanema sp. JU1783]|nr:unnamed protein product [Auanema sp. JU1783]
MNQLVLFTLISLSVLASAWDRPSHWGNPCYLCKCFIEYTDRDVASHIRPYAMAADGYDSTEDRCLATCQRDPRCHAAVFGMVGGRQVFTCEFYEEIDAHNSPTYTSFINIYYKRATCPLSNSHLPSVSMIPADDSSVKRRIKKEKKMGRKNPFFG